MLFQSMKSGYDGDDELPQSSDNGQFEFRKLMVYRLFHVIDVFINFRKETFSSGSHPDSQLHQKESLQYQAGDIHIATT